jgi:hypothetical protein
VAVLCQLPTSTTIMDKPSKVVNHPWGVPNVTLWDWPASFQEMPRALCRHWLMDAVGLQGMLRKRLPYPCFWWDRKWVSCRIVSSCRCIFRQHRGRRSRCATVPPAANPGRAGGEVNSLVATESQVEIVCRPISFGLMYPTREP